MKELFLLLCFSVVVFDSEAFIFPKTTTAPPQICLNNQNGNSLIRGDSNNAIQNYLSVIRSSGYFILYGAGSSNDGGCRQAIDKYRTRKYRTYNNIQWTLDCWVPAECLMEEDKSQTIDVLFNLLPVSSSSSSTNKVRTVLLPLDNYETISYTFLPSVTKTNTMFVTVTLSGCSVFVATPNNLNCNILVLHANFGCHNQSATGPDNNHLQAMSVLEEVESTNSLCRYRIERRWAADYWRPTIEAAHYYYGNKVFYYNWDRGENFLYGNHLGGTNGHWQFCIRVADDNPPPETCYNI